MIPEQVRCDNGRGSLNIRGATPTKSRRLRGCLHAKTADIGVSGTTYRSNRRIRLVVTGEYAGFQPIKDRHHAIQEISIMGDHNQGALKLFEHGLQYFARFDVQMVGGFIEIRVLIP